MELLDIKALCHLLGGTRPLNPCSIYRYIQQGKLPRPSKVGGNSRWLRSEVEACLRKMMEAGNGRG